MSVSFDVVARPRQDTGKGASRRLRRQGLVPAIVYGAHREPEMVSLVHNDLIRRLEDEAFYSHILNLEVGEKTDKVVIKDMQRHPAKPFILHVDFLRVSAEDKIRMIVPLHFINESSAKGVKLGGAVTHYFSEIEISCLPKDLPEFIAIDMAEMDIGDTLHLSRIPLPEGVTLAHAPDPDGPVVAVHTKHAKEETDEADEEGAEPES